MTPRTKTGRAAWRRLLAIAAVAATVVACTGGDLNDDDDETTASTTSSTTSTTVAAPPEPEPTALQDALLTITDLPPGWAVETSGGDQLCDVDVAGLLGIPQDGVATVSFSEGLGTLGESLITERLWLVPDDVSDPLSAIRDAYLACDGASEGDQTITVGEASVDPLGDETLGLRFLITVDSQTAELDVVIARTGNLLVGVAAGSGMGEADEMVAEWAPVAYDKATAALGL